MLGWLAVVQDTLTHTQEESFVTSGTHQATGRCRLGSFLQSSKNLLLGTCSGRVLCPGVVPQRSHKTHRCTFKRVDARYHWLPTKHSPSFLPILSGITPSETRRSASCLKLYTKALNPKHLLHETLYLKPPPKRLRSRKPPRSFVELLSINGEPTTPIPAALQSFTPSFGPQPPGCDLPRNAWIQLIRLRTGVG